MFDIRSPVGGKASFLLENATSNYHREQIFYGGPGLIRGRELQEMIFARANQSSKLEKSMKNMIFTKGMIEVGSLL